MRLTQVHAIALAAAAFLALVPLRLCAAPDIALQMTVDTVVPTAGQPVQFTITASNIGADAANGVQVTDQLPAELTIPAGMAAFPSTGTYDAATGVWSIGSLAAGANATLVIPAIVAVTTQPPCSVNVAVSSLALDTQTSNNRAVAAVKRTAADRCVDLGVSANGTFVPPCSEARHLDAYVYVSNRGPDDASNVYVDLGPGAGVDPGNPFRQRRLHDHALHGAVHRRRNASRAALDLRRLQQQATADGDVCLRHVEQRYRLPDDEQPGHCDE